MTHDNTQSDVVEDWDRLTGCANACGFPSIEAAIEHLADIHLASLSTKDSDAVLEELENVRAKYRELLFTVGIKHPNETRHETALRYLRQAETRTDMSEAKAEVQTPSGGNA